MVQKVRWEAADGGGIEAKVEGREAGGSGRDHARTKIGRSVPTNSTPLKQLPIINLAARGKEGMTEEACLKVRTGRRC